MKERIGWTFGSPKFNDRYATKKKYRCNGGSFKFRWIFYLILLGMAFVISKWK